MIDVIFYDTHLGPHNTIAERYAWGQLAIIFLLEANIWHPHKWIN